MRIIHYPQSRRTQRIRTRIINIEQDPYAIKARDPYYRVRRNQLLFHWVMIIAVGILVAWLTAKLGE